MTSHGHRNQPALIRRPSTSALEAASPWIVAAIHIVVAVATMIGLFLTVHRRDMQSQAFEDRWVASGVYQDRWSELFSFWGANGYWNHGGLWYINDDRPFRSWVESGTLNWFDPATFDPAVPYYYRSNTGLFAAPIGLLDRVVATLVGTGHARQVMVFSTQLIAAITAIFTGLLAHRLARSWGMGRQSALVLGLCAQVVLQTSPLILASYWRYYPTHAFAAALSAFMLALAIPPERDRLAKWLAGIGAFAMVAADLPHAMVALGAWALATWLGRDVLDEAKIAPRWRSTAIGAAAAAAVLATQFIVAVLHHPDARFVGSGFLFRTGLDGDRSRQSELLDGVWKLFEGPVMYGSPGRDADAGVAPFTWGILLAAPLLALVLSAIRRRALPIVPLVVGSGAFLGFVAAFSNAAAIHPFAYPVLIVGPGSVALFGVLPAAMTRHPVGRWVAVIAAIGVAGLLAMSGLRAFAVQFPTAGA